MIGRTLSHYRIAEKIGAGGMGEVYRARDEHLGRDVALKVLPAGTLADEQARRRFRKEAQALSKLNHPHIATVHDFDTQDGVDFLVMELVEGVTLSDKLAVGSLPEKEISRLGGQVAEALEEAHERGVVHRDLKPGNVMVTPKGQVKVLDFGLAKLVRPGVASATAPTESFTETQGVAGTLPYMAPEQLRGEPVDSRTDIHALGAVLYEMATGQRPFPETQGPRLIDAILNRAPQPPSGLNRRVSPGLENIILKALDKEPENRYQSAKELAVDLRRLGTPGSAAAVLSARRPARRQGMVLAVGIALVALGAVLVGLNVGGLRERLLGRPVPGPITSLAVLPLANLMNDPEQDYFVDGMHDELIAQLAQIEALKVISRTSVMHYKGANKPLPEIARELDVDAVVEGSVRRAGNRVRITAQLIHARTDMHLWAETYERDLRDILALQSDIARSIAREIHVKLTPQEAGRLATAQRVNPEAYEAYLKGRVHAGRFTPLEVVTAIQYFEEAVRQDPNYAQAHAWRAFCYFLLGQVLGHLPYGEAMRNAKEAALHALELDENVGYAHSVLGLIRTFYGWNWKEAEEEFRRAIELSPNDPLVHTAFAFLLTATRRPGEAFEEAQRAVELSPLDVLQREGLAEIFWLNRQHDRALEECKKILAIDPNFQQAYSVLKWNYDAKGMYREAVDALQEFLLLGGAPPETVDSLARAYRNAGARGYFRWQLDSCLKECPSGPVRSITLTTLYGRLGEMDKAFEWLEKAYQERGGELVFMQVSPDFDSLRDDPRFQSLLRRMNFPE